MAADFHRSFKAGQYEIPVIKDYITEMLTDWKLETQDIEDIILASDEAATNIIEHGYNNLSSDSSEGVIELRLKNSGEEIEIILEDYGKSFDLTKAPDPDLKLNMQGKRKGGFGVYLMKTLMNSVEYNTDGNKNTMKLIKKLKNSAPQKERK